MPHHRLVRPDWIDSAPTLVEHSVVIDAPPSDVWAHVVDHRSWPEWFTDLGAVEPHRDTSVGGGRRVTVSGITLDEEFTAVDVDEHFAFSVVRSPVPILAALGESVRLEPVGDGCRVTYRQGVEGRAGFGWLTDRAWRRAARSLPIALENLRARVELT
ncbi:SRPBCC family protein [Ilumatobacter sp.]|uniref:SRPBCC family protein n=1 Tax=Ilumatobacter sp. TaxID=1967498 RepID=UPI003B528953